jgi:hypothetical protein
MILKSVCSFCGSRCEISITDLSRKVNQKLNRCINKDCLAIMNRIPIDIKQFQNKESKLISKEKNGQFEKKLGEESLVRSIEVSK